MTEVDTVLTANEKQAVRRGISGLGRIIRAFGLATAWAFISAMIVGSLAAAIWTVIPTELIAWGAGGLNRMGYVSHCSFAPISTTVLLVVTSVGARLAFRLPGRRYMGRIVFGGTAGGLIFGAMMGIDIVMFMGMGIGLGVGMVFGLLFEILGRPGKKTEARV